MLEKYNLQLLNVGFDSNGAQWDWKNVSSPFARIYVIASGEAKILLDNAEIQLSDKKMCMIPPFTRHTCVGREGFSHFYLHFYEWPGASDSMFNELEFNSYIEYRSGSRELMEMLTTTFPQFALSNSNPLYYDNDEVLNAFCDVFANRPICERTLARGAIMVLASRFLKRISHHKNSPNALLEKVHNYINTHLSEDLSINRLADMACMSESHLIRSFKQQYGITPTQFALKRRIEVAQLMLRIRKDTLKEVALSVGFNDVAYFARIFKRHTGSTPDAYRKRPRL